MLSRTCFFFALLFLFAGPCGALCQQPVISQGETLTLEQAVELALQGNRQLKSSGIEVEKYDFRISAAKTRRLPEFKIDALGSQLLSSIDFKFDKGVFGEYPGIGPIPGNDTVITTPRRPTFAIINQVNQPISQLYRINLNIKQLGVGREIARRQLSAQQLSLVNNVKRAYYSILQTESALGAANESIRLYRELDRVTGEYVVQQVALKSEGLEVKTRLAKSELDASTLRDDLASQKEQLNQLLGRNVQTEFNVGSVQTASYYEVDLAAARTRAMDQRPEIQEARLKIKYAEYDRRIKKSEFIPDVSLSFNQVSNVNINFAPRQISSVGVAVSWEPFDWGRKKRELKEKSRSIDQAELTLQETESSVMVDVNARFRKLQQTRQQLSIGRMTEETAREQLRVMSNRYAAQAALLKDVLQAQTTVSEANYQYQQALLALWAARADFEKAIGGER